MAHAFICPCIFLVCICTKKNRSISLHIYIYSEMLEAHVHNTMLSRISVTARKCIPLIGTPSSDLCMWTHLQLISIMVEELLIQLSLTCAIGEQLSCLAALSVVAALKGRLHGDKEGTTLQGMLTTWCLPYNPMAIHAY